MALSTYDQNRIREYLLGHLNDEEQEEFEERLIVDDDLFEELEISKGELIEEYCAGELLGKERQWFERNYLASGEGHKRYALAVAISCLNRTAAQDPSWFERLRCFLTSHTWAVAATTTATLLIIVIVGVWSSRSGSGTIVSFALTNTTATRGQNNNSEIYRLKLNPNVTELRISLALPDLIPAGAHYLAELDDGRNIKSVRVIGQEGNSIVVSLPVADVPIGYYALRVFSTPPGGNEQQLPGDYRFIVE